MTRYKAGVDLLTASNDFVLQDCSNSDLHTRGPRYEHAVISAPARSLPLHTMTLSFAFAKSDGCCGNGYLHDQERYPPDHAPFESILKLGPFLHIRGSAIAMTCINQRSRDDGFFGELNAFVHTSPNVKRRRRACRFRLFEMIYKTKE